MTDSDARADVGEVFVVVGGVWQQAKFPRVELPHSDDALVLTFPVGNAEAFCKG